MSAPQTSPKTGSLLFSFGYALAGIQNSLSTERNLKIHWVSGTAVAILGSALPFEAGDRAFLGLWVLLVISAELFNTAIEAGIDLFSPKPHPLAKIAKDAAAGAVLVLAVGALAFLMSLLQARWALVLAHPEAVQRSLVFGLPALAAEALLLFFCARRWVWGALVLGLSVGWAGLWPGTSGIGIYGFGGLMAALAAEASLRRLKTT